MEILAILMIAFILFAISMFIFSFVMFKRKKTDDMYRNENYFDDVNDLDDNSNLDVSVNSNDNSLAKSENLEVVVNPFPILPDANLVELINVLINKKNYIFLSNGNIVNKGDHIKLIYNNKMYYGTITKANYRRDINDFKVKPQKLVIAKNVK